MMGTFATVLANQKIPTSQERFRADVTGDIENVNGVLKITRINVHYTLKLAEDKQAAAQKAFEVYLPHCPAAQSVITSIQIDHQLDMEALN
jgi:uncharacterized OsmC-like protein